MFTVYYSKYEIRQHSSISLQQYLRHNNIFTTTVSSSVQQYLLHYNRIFTTVSLHHNSISSPHQYLQTTISSIQLYCHHNNIFNTTLSPLEKVSKAALSALQQYGYLYSMPITTEWVPQQYRHYNSVTTTV